MGRFYVPGYSSAPQNGYTFNPCLTFEAILLKNQPPNTGVVGASDPVTGNWLFADFATQNGYGICSLWSQHGSLLQTFTPQACQSASFPVQGITKTTNQIGQMFQVLTNYTWIKMPTSGGATGSYGTLPGNVGVNLCDTYCFDAALSILFAARTQVPQSYILVGDPTQGTLFNSYTPRGTGVTIQDMDIKGEFLFVLWSDFLVTRHPTGNIMLFTTSPGAYTGTGAKIYATGQNTIEYWVGAINPPFYQLLFDQGQVTALTPNSAEILNRWPETFCPINDGSGLPVYACIQGNITTDLYLCRYITN